MRRSKYIIVAERLAKRITNGDYHLNGIPSERDLAVDVGVSHMTARKAIKKLLDDKLIVRLPNGRLDIQSNGKDSPKNLQTQIALLAPSWNSFETNTWNMSLSRMAQKFDFSFRLVYYLHSDDPVIKNTISRFDCTFFLPSDPMPQNIVKELQEINRPFVIVNNDWSHIGIPSIRLFPPVFIHKMLDHLASLGHKRIDCLNVQPGGNIISERITQWRIWLEAHGSEGYLYDHQATPYTNSIPIAYETIDALIKNGKFECDALLCLTEPAAVGAMRALADNGLCPGKDIAICTTDSDGYTKYAIPSITSMEHVDPIPYITTCVKWIQRQGKNWDGQLLLQPADIKVVVRQSTVSGGKPDSILKTFIK